MAPAAAPPPRRVKKARAAPSSATAAALDSLASEEDVSLERRAVLDAPVDDDGWGASLGGEAAGRGGRVRDGVAGGEEEEKDGGAAAGGVGVAEGGAVGGSASATKRPSKHARRRARESAEQALRRSELARASGLSAPRTDAECLSAAQSAPLCSYLWLRLMARRLSSGDASGAREAGRLALEALPLREAGERLNVFLARHALELSLGDFEAARARLAEALARASPSRVRPAAAAALAAAGRADEARECLAAWCKEAPGEVEAWLAAYRHAVAPELTDPRRLAEVLGKGKKRGRGRMGDGEDEEEEEEEEEEGEGEAGHGGDVGGVSRRSGGSASGFSGSADLSLPSRHSGLFASRHADQSSASEILSRASRSALPKDATRLATGAARLQYLFGDADAGRAIFEKLLRDKPRRLDVWSAYLDREVAHGDARRARSLFERATHLELPPRKMKFLFRRYLEFEQKHGDEDAVQHVRDAAMAFVERATQGGVARDAEE